MRILISLMTALVACWALGASTAVAQTVGLSEFGGQAFNAPFHVTGAPGDPSRVFVVESGGVVRLVKDGVTQPTSFLDITGDVQAGGESGLLSMAVAPDYATSGLFYLFYTRDDPTPGQEHYLRIEEFRRSAVNPDVADLSSRRIVLEIPHLLAGNHNGGQIQFGSDGLLYISTGDGGGGNDQFGNGQNLTTLLGKILRINPAGTAPFQYSVPAGNPFADGTGPNADEIYSYGLRNPWRFSFDRLTGDLTIGDVGQAEWEEVNFVPDGGGRGANFGWNCFEGTAAFSSAPPSCTPPPANHIPPVIQYANPPGATPAAVVGGFVIRDGALPSLVGRYVYADTYDALGSELRTAVLKPGAAEGDSGLGVSISIPVSFGEDACGHIYVASLGTGRVYRLEPVNGPLPCMPATPPGAGTEPKPALLAKVGHRAAKAGAVVVKARCDRSCEVTGDAVIRIPPKGSDGGKRLKADGATAPLEPGAATKLRLKLSAKEVAALREALGQRRHAVADVQLAVSGAGGSRTYRQRARQKR